MFIKEVFRAKHRSSEAHFINKSFVVLIARKGFTMFVLIFFTIAITIIPGMAQFPGESALADLPVWPSDGKCTSGVLYRRKCYVCYCVRDNSAVCSVVGCDPNDLRETIDVGELPLWPDNGLNCIPGQSYRRDCNTCVCYESGFGVCSEVNCSLNVNRKGLTIAYTKPLWSPELPFSNTCGPGTHWKRCEHCWCSHGNDPVCTTVGCEDEQGIDYAVNPYASKIV